MDVIVSRVVVKKNPGLLINQVVWHMLKHTFYWTLTDCILNQCVLVNYHLHPACCSILMLTRNSISTDLIFGMLNLALLMCLHNECELTLIRPKIKKVTSSRVLLLVL